MLRHPLGLLADWNWKSGVLSALLYSPVFFAGNRRAGHHAAFKALAVEAIYSVITAGLAGSVTQRLRHAVPRARTALVVWLGLPSALLLGRLVVHTALGTPRLRASLVASFLFAALASGFNWFSMSRGAFVTGEPRSFARDLRLVPQLLYSFVTAPFR